MRAFAFALLAAATSAKKVYGGERVEPADKYPFSVALLLSSKIGSGSDVYKAAECGAALLDPADLRAGNSKTVWALTAAHCCEGKASSPKYHAMVFGNNLRKTGGDECTEIIKVDSFIRHPKGNPGNDYKTYVCLVHLKTEPRCGPQKRDAGQLMTLASARKPAGTYLTHAGWGSTSKSWNNPKYPDHLREVDLPLLSAAQCRKADDWADDGYICTHHPDKDKASCAGDSGSPLFIKEGGKWVTFGINSFGDRIGKDPDFFADVVEYASWIRSVIPDDEGGGDDPPSPTTTEPSTEPSTPSEPTAPECADSWSTQKCEKKGKKLKKWCTAKKKKKKFRHDQCAGTCMAYCDKAKDKAYKDKCC